MVGGGARAVARCDALGVAPYSDAPDMLFRAWLTPGFVATQAQVAEWMIAAGMTVWYDAATNLIGRYEGVTPEAPALLIGSHIDSVRDAGRYDGPLGVMLGIECVSALRDAARRLPFAIEVIAFGDEEGSRFPTAMLTSRALVGPVAGDVLAVCDADGVSVREALADYRRRGGGRDRWGAGVASDNAAAPAFAGVTDLSGALRDPGSVIAYLEAHIEQGPALDGEGLAVGIVTGIAAQLRYRVVVDGMAGHAGTTAMTLRRDALAAAAEMVLAVERLAHGGPADLVATVGRMTVSPNATNVIPGRVEFSIDIRALDAGVRDATARAIRDAIDAIGTARGIGVTIEQTNDLPASLCDPKLVGLLADAARAAGQPDRRLASGAGHDAMIMSALCPTAMLFIACAGGISHNPAEQVAVADVEIALQVMLGFITRLGADFDA
ncbi:Zn-dependent hydrolase [Sphingomonas sp. GB1N7]|uniref:Zn-dependent hydrolase n=1 Tax=Parasphingomonas caseinilytica TaxID=3096158 RepID=UPI002FCC925C